MEMGGGTTLHCLQHITKASYDSEKQLTPKDEEDKKRERERERGSSVLGVGSLAFPGSHTSFSQEFGRLVVGGEAKPA